jgi:hypothetical protein
MQESAPHRGELLYDMDKHLEGKRAGGLDLEKSAGAGLAVQIAAIGRFYESNAGLSSTNGVFGDVGWKTVGSKHRI